MVGQTKLFRYIKAPVYVCIFAIPYYQALLILDGVDALYEDREKEAHTGLVKIIDELCRITPNLKFVLTCKEQLLQETDVPLSNTKELVSISSILHVLCTGVCYDFALQLHAGFWGSVAVHAVLLVRHCIAFGAEYLQLGV